ncbi:hypothetical protein ATK74_0589 [Propionicimonas paludicola]|uniref:Ig-like domain-containing protein n=1 Tax=Propionicimonas paludicola TaxID=185243 RepID=A0A2A9CQY3_9ACTN|nr:PxKF domain-containing protein [Propionicimonas paludicola]PFG16060.1 hypothetical protein ATK74_0589 [Propionicimonas paludicola]
MSKARLARTLIGVGLTLVLSSIGLVPASAASAPVITWDSQIVNGASYLFGEVPSAPTCTATEDGVPVTCTVEGYSAAVGTQVLTATGVASDGVTTTVDTRTYTVTAWRLKGFDRPVKNNVVNKVKAGSTVPLKFRVYQGATKAKSVSVVSSITAQRFDCASLALVGDPVSVTADRKGQRLRYYDGRFHQNWKTPKLSAPLSVTKAKGKKPVRTAACYRIVLTTQDASTLSATFQLR